MEYTGGRVKIIWVVVFANSDIGRCPPLYGNKVMIRGGRLLPSEIYGNKGLTRGGRLLPSEILRKQECFGKSKQWIDQGPKASPFRKSRKQECYRPYSGNLL